MLGRPGPALSGHVRRELEAGKALMASIDSPAPLVERVVGSGLDDVRFITLG
jgi:hypothetical protein